MRAGESMREATSRPVRGCVAESRGGGRRCPAALASNHCTGPFRPGRWLAGRRRGCGSGRGRGGRWPRRAVRGASLTVGRLRGRRPGDGEGVRGNRAGGSDREGARGGQLAEEDGGLRASAPAAGRDGGEERGRERGRRWPGTRQLAVGHGCARTVVEAARQLAAALTSWQWAGGTAGRNTRDQGPPRGGGPGRHGGAAMGRGDARAVGERRRQESALSPAGEISRRHARIRPVRVYIYSYTHAPSPPSTTAVRHTRGDGSGYISLDGDGAADPRRR